MFVKTTTKRAIDVVRGDVLISAIGRPNGGRFVAFDVVTEDAHLVGDDAIIPTNNKGEIISSFSNEVEVIDRDDVHTSRRSLEDDARQFALDLLTVRVQDEVVDMFETDD